MLDERLGANVLEVHLQGRQGNTDVPRVLWLRIEPTRDTFIDEGNEACCYDDTEGFVSKKTDR